VVGRRRKTLRGFDGETNPGSKVEGLSSKERHRRNATLLIEAIHPTKPRDGADTTPTKNRETIQERKRGKVILLDLPAREPAFKRTGAVTGGEPPQAC